MSERTYIAIDLKSFYASVECVERGLDPLKTNLVVADESRTEKTICLAVTPTLKAYGLSGRSRLFEVYQKSDEVKKSTGRELEFIIARPRMALYIEYSTRIYEIYLKYISKDDIQVYSVDEVFMDVTHYLSLYKMSAEELARTIIMDVLNETGITATAGIAPNLYLAKVAMDIGAKHIEADSYGVRIASLDERSYKEKLWGHKPITDFWRTGPGTAKRLEKYGMHTMGDVARISLTDEDTLFKIFGIDAEILIDHAWGYEPCTIEDIKRYKPRTNSLSSGQVLSDPYDYNKTRVVIREMIEGLVLEMVDKGLAAPSFTLDISYDRISVDSGFYKGETRMDRYGRTVPKSAHGTANFGTYTSSTKKITEACLKTFDEIIDRDLMVRRLNVAANNVMAEGYEQFDIFTDAKELEKEKKMQQAMISIKKRFGKNAILKGTNFEEGATMKERNRQIGGHRA